MDPSRWSNKPNVWCWSVSVPTVGEELMDPYIMWTVCEWARPMSRCCYCLVLMANRWRCAGCGGSVSDYPGALSQLSLSQTHATLCNKWANQGLPSSSSRSRLHMLMMSWTQEVDAALETMSDSPVWRPEPPSDQMRMELVCLVSPWGVLCSNRSIWSLKRLRFLISCQTEPISDSHSSSSSTRHPSKTLELQMFPELHLSSLTSRVYRLLTPRWGHDSDPAGPKVKGVNSSTDYSSHRPKRQRRLWQDYM